MHRLTSLLRPLIRILPAPVYYFLVAILVPGGTLLVLALWLARRNRKEMKDAVLAESFAQPRFDVGVPAPAGLRPGASA